ncbi:unnamed protein product [Fusarium graminearum]|uniref:Uncharacterized protein n=1 Tax=Gibberella zeae TaxID=5518 RepID=A0A4U9F6G5_GIBZA|nr:unnamed protein product [Fusarium graminearum]CAG1998162.1 unnamed protein product [Fusarium graminearum]CAG2002965.1 unnamed protein product [Fusarium graminearum]VTO91679.1 unnamed protein product [Fusarium graminearum]
MKSTFHSFGGNSMSPFLFSDISLSFDFATRQDACEEAYDTPLFGTEFLEEESSHGVEPGNDFSYEYTILAHQWFQQFRQLLTSLLFGRFQSFTNTVQYVAPATFRRCHGNKPDPQDGPVVSTHLINLYSDSSDRDDGFIFISPPKRNYHYACPFEALYPKQYQQCLLQHCLRSTDDVKNHLKRYHIKPLYCPTCSEVFETLIQRDHHIIKRSCELQDLRVPKKLNAHQQEMLTRIMKMNISHEERWNSIFTTIFPNREPPSSPYLDYGRRLAISVAQDYFIMDGRHYVSEFLQAQGLDTTIEEDQHAHAALCQLALEDFLGCILERYRDIEER